MSPKPKPGATFFLFFLDCKCKSVVPWCYVRTGETFRQSRVPAGRRKPLGKRTQRATSPADARQSRCASCVRSTRCSSLLSLPLLRLCPPCGTREGTINGGGCSRGSRDGSRHRASLGNTRHAGRDHRTPRLTEVLLLRGTGRLPLRPPSSV